VTSAAIAAASAPRHPPAVLRNSRARHSAKAQAFSVRPDPQSRSAFKVQCLLIGFLSGSFGRSAGLA